LRKVSEGRVRLQLMSSALKSHGSIQDANVRKLSGHLFEPNHRFGIAKVADARNHDLAPGPTKFKVCGFGIHREGLVTSCRNLLDQALDRVKLWQTGQYEKIHS
jgi:hypothetical protein